jgi:LysR family hydrogen peroxide-inducible transcriptional activator
MNLRDLKYFVSVVELGHFGKAAETCFISQPALSMQIKKLEETLGVQLLERTGKAILLTDIGKIIYERAQAILMQAAEIHQIAKQAKDPFVGALHLGIIPTIAPYLLPHIVPGLSRTFPQLNLYLIEAQTTQLLEKLQQGKLDVGLLALPVDQQDFVTTPLFEEEFLLAVPNNHALAKRKIIRDTDLENKDVLLLEDGHCLRGQALEVCDRMRANVSKSFQGTSLETLRHMVASEVGITLMPKLSCRSNDGVSYIPFNAPKPTRTVGLIWRNSSAKATLLDALAETIKKFIPHGDGRHTK